MEDEKLLFSLSLLGESLHVISNIDNQHEMMQFAFIISDYILKNEAFSTSLEMLLKVRCEHPELEYLIDNNTIDVPDFNQILNNGKR